MSWLEQSWYRITLLHLLLWPVSLLFGLLVAVRRILYRSGVLSRFKLPVPVIVIGNISVGGTGKTPFALWLAQQLLDEGWHPAIISRGYSKAKQQAGQFPRAVDMNDSSDEVGDEPLLMVQRNLCPVWVGRDRVAAAQALLKAHPACDVILSDDGLQHYRMQRDVEIVLVDGKRRFGNGLLLPAGPLREPVTRLDSVDFVIVNGGELKGNDFAMNLEGSSFYNLLNPNVRVIPAEFSRQSVHAIAGIGHPQRFFAHLERLGLSVQQHPFSDHHCYSAADIEFSDADAILMTEKDAVKCAAFATEKFWVLRVDAQIDPALTHLIIGKIKK